MINLTTKKLSKLLTIKNGSDYKHLNTGNIPLLGSGGIMGYVDDKLYDKKSILLPRKGTLDNIMFIEFPFWTVDTLYWSELNEEKVSPYYLYLYLSLLDLSPISTGSTLPSMTMEAYYSLEIDLPDRKHQDKIADFIYKVDSLIENNNSLVKKIYNHMDDLYNYWFTQFDFLDENGKPYKTSGGKMVWNEKLKREIPEHWELSNIKEKFNITTGKRDANFATENGKYTFFTCSDKVFKGDEKSFEGKSILLAGNGNFNVKAYNGEFDAYQRTYVIQPKNELNFGLGYLSVKVMSDHLSKSSAGSIVKFITISDVENISFFKQNDVDIEIFNILLEKILLLQKENEELIRQRALLLPLLMNGQVVIK